MKKSIQSPIAMIERREFEPAPKYPIRITDGIITRSDGKRELFVQNSEEHGFAIIAEAIGKIDEEGIERRPTTDALESTELAVEYLVSVFKSLHKNEPSEYPPGNIGQEISFLSRSLFELNPDAGHRITVEAVKVFDLEGKLFSVVTNVGNSRTYHIRGNHHQLLSLEGQLPAAEEPELTKQQQLQIFHTLDSVTEDEYQRLEPRIKELFEKSQYPNEYLGKPGMLPHIYTGYLEKGDRLIMLSSRLHRNLHRSEIQIYTGLRGRRGAYSLKPLLHRALDKAHDEENPGAVVDNMAAVAIEVL